MKSRSLNSFLLRFLILTLSILDNVEFSTTMSVETHHHGSRRIHLPRLVEISRKFPCREPQARAYILRDLMKNLYQNTGESASQPVYLVVKRCDGHSGCCTSPDMSCTPVETSIYYEEIEVEIWSLKTNDTRRQWIKVEQHGRCTCEDTTINDRYLQPNVSLI